MKQDFQPTTLEGTHIRLEPLNEKHADTLFHVGKDPKIWQWLTRAEFSNIDDTKRWIQHADHLAMLGEQLPFAIVDIQSSLAVGSTRYINIDTSNNCCEIGRTWLAPRYQRTGANTESKYLLLCHAFDTQKVNRVQMTTDLRNIQAQKAIERIGATKEGVLRSHLINYDGHRRDSVVYSILDFEWPKVKAHIEELLEA